jgi:hypothetical protein
LYVSTVEIDEKGNAKKLLLVKSKRGLEASFRKNDIEQINKNLFHFTFDTPDGRIYGVLNVND